MFVTSWRLPNSTGVLYDLKVTLNIKNRRQKDQLKSIRTKKDLRWWNFRTVSKFALQMTSFGHDGQVRRILLNNSDLIDAFRVVNVIHWACTLDQANKLLCLFLGCLCKLFECRAQTNEIRFWTYFEFIYPKQTLQGAIRFSSRGLLLSWITLTHWLRNLSPLCEGTRFWVTYELLLQI